MTTTTPTDAVAAVEDVSAEYRLRRTTLSSVGRPAPTLRALDRVSLTVRPKEIVALVGESGSGKTTLAHVIAGLKAPTDGHVVVDGRPVKAARGRARRELAGAVQIVFQDPHASLSPRLNVAYLLNEPYIIHGIPPTDRLGPSLLLETVGLGPDQLRKYPHELSGGQARRIGIARALALRPALVVADEPTAGLDVSAAAAVLNLLRSLADDGTTAFLLITHNLNIVSYVADRIAVMYLGQIVESGRSDEVITSPRHPYTAGLIASVAVPDPGARRRRAAGVRGEIPSAANPPPGCRFHTRCPFADDKCRTTEPALERVEGTDRSVRCHYWPRLAGQLQSHPSAAISDTDH